MAEIRVYALHPRIDARHLHLRAHVLLAGVCVNGFWCPRCHPQIGTGRFSVTQKDREKIDTLLHLAGR